MPVDSHESPVICIFPDEESARAASHRRIITAGIDVQRDGYLIKTKKHISPPQNQEV